MYEPKTLSYTTPGTYTWTAPEGVTSVTATVAGAGGGGGGGIKYQIHKVGTSHGSSGYSNGGDGGNGDKQAKTINVIPGNQYTIVVGAGGTTGAEKNLGSFYTVNGTYTRVGEFAGRDGEKGGNSKFGNFVTAEGGQPGKGGIKIFDNSYYAHHEGYDDEWANYQKACSHTITGANGANTGNGQGGQGGFSAKNNSFGYGSNGQNGQNGWVTLTYTQPKMITQTVTKPGASGGQGGLTTQTLSVTPGEKIQITVGAGGIAGVTSKNGGNGGTTTVSGEQGEVTAQGGGGGIAPTQTSGGVDGISYGTGGKGGAEHQQ